MNALLSLFVNCFNYTFALYCSMRCVIVPLNQYDYGDDDDDDGDDDNCIGFYYRPTTVFYIHLFSYYCCKYVNKPSVQ